MLYIFVDIKLDACHFIDTVAHNFAKDGKLFTTHFDLLVMITTNLNVYTILVNFV